MNEMNCNRCIHTIILKGKKNMFISYRLIDLFLFITSFGLIVNFLIFMKIKMHIIKIIKIK